MPKRDERHESGVLAAWLADDVRSCRQLGTRAQEQLLDVLVDAAW